MQRYPQTFQTDHLVGVAEGRPSSCGRSCSDEGFQVNVGDEGFDTGVVLSGMLQPCVTISLGVLLQLPCTPVYRTRAA